jgi:glycerol-3-phosphate dehydrogenase (NAD(P)+)
MAPARVSVIGAGAFGTAMAYHLARAGHDTVLWAREPAVRF